jgi:hypothetical protein
MLFIITLTPDQLDWLKDEIEAVYKMEYSGRESTDKDRQLCAEILKTLTAAKGQL